MSTLVFRLGMLAVELILAPSPMHLVNIIIYDYIHYFVDKVVIHPLPDQGC